MRMLFVGLSYEVGMAYADGLFPALFFAPISSGSHSISSLIIVINYISIL